jgi:hypothetical protein
MVGSTKEGFDFAQSALLSIGVVLRQIWTQCGLGCLGIKDDKNSTWHRILDVVGCSFSLLRRVCWPALEECYVILFSFSL